MTTVTESLAKPLAEAAVGTCAAQLAALPACIRANAWSFCLSTSHKQRRALAAGLVRNLAPFTVASAAAETRSALVNAAMMLAPDEGARFTLTYFIFHVPRRHATLDVHKTKVAELSVHAMARLFQRRGTLNLGVVRQELAPAADVGVALNRAARALGLRQGLIPTANGCLVGEYDKAFVLHARTWMAWPSARWRPVADAVVSCAKSASVADDKVRKVRGDVVALRRLAAMQCLHDDDNDVLATTLVRALEPFKWLRKPYARRPDPVADAWAQARKHAA